MNKINIDNIENIIEPVVGVVTDCFKLNIRKRPNIDSEVICVVPAFSELTITMDKSTSKWFKVCTETGETGYCMKKYVAVKSQD